MNAVMLEGRVASGFKQAYGTSGKSTLKSRLGVAHITKEVNKQFII